MAETLGARLRRSRERQQVALVTISEQTKIKLSLLEALERDDVSQWPSGIFRRAFVRAYAEAVGLDPDLVVREFLELYPDPSEAAATSLESVVRADGEAARGAAPTRLRFLAGSVIGSLTRMQLGGVQRRRSAANDHSAARAVAVRAPAFDDGVVDSPRMEPPALFDHFETPALFDQPVVADPPVEVPETFQESADCAVDEMSLEEPAMLLADPPAEDPPVEQVANFADPSGEEAETEPAPWFAEPFPEQTQTETSAGFEPDLLAAAEVCTALGRVDALRDAAPFLQEAATILDAVGAIVWVWHPQDAELRPELAHGYSERVLAQLPKVGPDMDNATAAAFRSDQTCVVNSSVRSSGALAVPLMTPRGCAGVLSIELQHGSEQKESVRALVTIFSAQLARVVGATRTANAVDRRRA